MHINLSIDVDKLKNIETNEYSMNILKNHQDTMEEAIRFFMNRCSNNSIEMKYAGRNKNIIDIKNYEDFVREMDLIEAQVGQSGHIVFLTQVYDTIIATQSQDFDVKLSRNKKEEYEQILFMDRFMSPMALIDYSFCLANIYDIDTYKKYLNKFIERKEIIDKFLNENPTEMEIIVPCFRFQEEKEKRYIRTISSLSDIFNIIICKDKYINYFSTEGAYEWIEALLERVHSSKGLEDEDPNFYLGSAKAVIAVTDALDDFMQSYFAEKEKFKESIVNEGVVPIYINSNEGKIKYGDNNAQEIIDAIQYYMENDQLVNKELLLSYNNKEFLFKDFMGFLLCCCKAVDIDYSEAFFTNEKDLTKDLIKIMLDNADNNKLMQVLEHSLEAISEATDIIYEYEDLYVTEDEEDVDFENVNTNANEIDNIKQYKYLIEVFKEIHYDLIHNINEKPEFIKGPGDENSYIIDMVDADMQCAKVLWENGFYVSSEITLYADENTKKIGIEIPCKDGNSIYINMVSKNEEQDLSGLELGILRASTQNDIDLARGEETLKFFPMLNPSKNISIEIKQNGFKVEEVIKETVSTRYDEDNNKKVEAFYNTSKTIIAVQGENGELVACVSDEINNVANTYSIQNENTKANNMTNDIAEDLSSDFLQAMKTYKFLQYVYKYVSENIDISIEKPYKLKMSDEKAKINELYKKMNGYFELAMNKDIHINADEYKFSICLGDNSHFNILLSGDNEKGELKEIDLKLTQAKNAKQNNTIISEHVDKIEEKFDLKLDVFSSSQITFDANNCVDILEEYNDGGYDHYKIKELEDGSIDYKEAADNLENGEMER